MTKVKWRRTWFQVHKWIGLALAILVIPLSLSGAALVYDEAVDHGVNPQRYAVSGTARLGADAYAAAAMARLKPGERVAQLTWPEDDGPVVVAAAGDKGQARPGPPQRTMVYLDPPTARVLDVAASNTGLLRFVHVLHGSLQVPGVGRTIVGVVGVAMMVSALHRIVAVVADATGRFGARPALAAAASQPRRQSAPDCSASGSRCRSSRCR